MLSSGDLGNIASLIDPNHEPIHIGEVQDVDISHLDYSYITSCNDVKEIKSLLDHLKSGKEGYYPELELHMMKRLATLDPDKHPMPLSSREMYEEKQKIANELQEWVSSLPQDTHRDVRETFHDENVQGIKREITAPIMIETKANTATNPADSKESRSERIKSNDYRSWDKYIANVDKELETIDQIQPSSSQTPAIINTPTKKTYSVPPTLSFKQRVAFAENEKVKGNDCMRALEYSEAVEYYTKSLALHNSSIVLNNRALSYLKLEKYFDCIEDCTSSLAMETNFKALLRRANSYYHIGKYQLAIMDIDQALELDSKSIEADSLRKKVMDKWSDVDGTITSSSISNAKDSTKVKIQEIEDVEEEIIMTPGALRQQAMNSYTSHLGEKKNKVVIVDVDDESSDED